MNLGVEIKGLEVCICKANDLLKLNFAKVHKRKILPPLIMVLSLRKSMVLAKDLRSFIDRTIIKANLSKTRLKVCFKDFDLLKAGANYQLE
jgi:hypothetical protein